MLLYFGLSYKEYILYFHVFHNYKTCVRTRVSVDMRVRFMALTEDAGTAVSNTVDTVHSSPVAGNWL
jgi:hypothetical protein